MKFGSPATRNQLACHGRSHVGLVRSANEDSFGLASESGIFVVADGMGGHDNGRYVADCAVAAACRVKPAGSLEATLATARGALERTNREIFAHAHELDQTMGATLVAVVIERDRVGVLWAGDSRGYLFRDGELYCLTRDHSAVQQLLDSGAISVGEAFEHPMRHVVTRALGVTASLEIDGGSHALLPDDIILLSTDGLHGAVSDEDIGRCLARHDLDALDPLIEIALAAGGRDNVTAVLVKV